MDAGKDFESGFRRELVNRRMFGGKILDSLMAIAPENKIVPQFGEGVLDDLMIDMAMVPEDETVAQLGEGVLDSSLVDMVMVLESKAEMQFSRKEMELATHDSLFAWVKVRGNSYSA